MTGSSGDETPLRKLCRLGIRAAASKAAVRARSAIRRRWLTLLYHTTGRTHSPAWRLHLALKKESRPILASRAGVVFPFWNIERAEETAEKLRNEHPQHVQAIIDRADAYVEGRYKILGWPEINLKKRSKELHQGLNIEPTNLPWHFDWERGYRWDPGRAYSWRDWENLEALEIKRPWELCRFQHLVTLAQAWVLTRQNRYRDEIAAQILAWHAQNPPGMGIHWSSSMEVGIRLANVLFSLGLLGKELDSPEASLQELRRILPGFVFDHALHLLYHPEWPNNHRIAAMAGLAAAAALYPHFQASASWAAQCRQDLEWQMQTQVYADGMDFEASTSYHRLVLECFFISRLLWDKRESETGIFDERLKKMFEAARVFRKPWGAACQVGDNDSGRFLILAPERALLDHRYLDAWENKTAEPETYWLFGPDLGRTKEPVENERESVRIESRAEPTDEREKKVKILPQGGLYSFRDDSLGHFLLIALQPNGQHGVGGHAHNDKLSFELSCYGEDWFIDPGSACYLEDRNLRDLMRSTYSHNTLGIAAEEQNRMNRGPFALSGDVKNPQMHTCVYDAQRHIFFFEGSHDGYRRIAPGWMHRRRLELHPMAPVKLIVTDFLECAGPPEKPVSLCWNFLLAPGLKVEHCRAGKALISTPGGRSFEISALMPLEVREALYSPQYGATVHIQAVTCKNIAQNSVQHSFTVEEIF